MGSRDADIDFTFTYPTTVCAVVDALTGAGWSAVAVPGGVSYMINDADDMYEWYDSPPDGIGEALALLDEPGNLPYTVALNVYHPEAETGGMLMFLPGRTDISFVPTMDRRHIPAAPEFTDLAWYLHALVPALVTAGLEGYEAREIRY
ncbi:hypothetical protein ABZ532_06915 [Streptomyces sp. NPDC019396]|uniref:hypothetical protein n=1 Tax=Streptomyces sp. NPDC019396 TaxID=3154687 RepID=UPI0033EFE12F